MNADEYIELVQAPGHPISYPMLIRMLYEAFEAGQANPPPESIAYNDGKPAFTFKPVDDDKPRLTKCCKRK